MKENRCNLPDGRVLTWYEAGRGKPLVLLHGWAMSAAVFSEVVALLAADFHLLVPDLPGHGRSAPAAQNNLAGISEILVSWLAAVVKGPLGLVGWSLGGMLSLEIARQQVLPVDRLVLVSTTPRFTLGDGWDFGLPLAQVRALARNLERRFEATLADFFALSFAGEQIDSERLLTIRRFAVKRSPLPGHAAARGLLDVLAAQDQRASLAEIQQPALILHGDQDRIAPVAAGQYLAERLPRGNFSSFAGIAHGPFLSQPMTAAAQIREFC
jgi:pimeloyl-[acyl-carrier protein] methyl ester esterase